MTRSYELGNMGNLFTGNGTSNVVTFSNSIVVTNTISVGSNLTVNTSTIFVGNSTVNTVANSSVLNVGANVSLTSTQLSVGNSTVNTVANSTALYSSGNALSPFVGMKNRIINGGMDIWQRATSSTLTSVVTYQSVDRWAARNSGGAAGAFTRDSSAPTGFQYSCKIGRNNGVSTVGVVELIQVLETVNSIPFQGQQVTLSFYAKAGANFSATSSVMGATLYSGTGTDQAAASLGGWTGVNTFASSAPTLTTSWQRFTLTGTVPSNSTQLGIYLYYTPTGTSGADDNLYITGVQLEQGSVATPFERRIYGHELALCQRYYQRVVYGALGYSPGSVNAGGRVAFPVPMRSTPTASASDLGNTTAGTTTIDSLAPTGLRFYAGTTGSGGFEIQVGTNLSIEL